MVRTHRSGSSRTGRRHQFRRSNRRRVKTHDANTISEAPAPSTIGGVILRLLFFIFLLIWALMHWYVLARLSSVPGIAGHVPTWVLVIAGVLLGSSYIV